MPCSAMFRFLDAHASHLAGDLLQKTRHVAHDRKHLQLADLAAGSSTKWFGSTGAVKKQWSFLSLGNPKTGCSASASNSSELAQKACKDLFLITQENIFWDLLSLSSKSPTRGLIEKRLATLLCLLVRLNRMDAHHWKSQGAQLPNLSWRPLALEGSSLRCTRRRAFLPQIFNPNAAVNCQNWVPDPRSSGFPDESPQIRPCHLQLPK